MLPRKHRLRKQKAFERVAKQGRFFRVGPIAIKVVGQTEKGPIRLGIPVSRKIAAKAVQRNRLRRRLRAVLRAFLPRLADGYDVMFLPASAVLTMSPEEIAASLEELFEKAGLIEKSKVKPQTGLRAAETNKD